MRRGDLGFSVWFGFMQGQVKVYVLFLGPFFSRTHDTLEIFNSDTNKANNHDMMFNDSQQQKTEPRWRRPAHKPMSAITTAIKSPNTFSVMYQKSTQTAAVTRPT